MQRQPSCPNSAWTGAQAHNVGTGSQPHIIGDIKIPPRSASPPGAGNFDTMVSIPPEAPSFVRSAGRIAPEAAISSKMSKASRIGKVTPDGTPRRASGGTSKYSINVLPTHCTMKAIARRRFGKHAKYCCRLVLQPRTRLGPAWFTFEAGRVYFGGWQ